MTMWLRAFEIWLTARLLASPSFHRAVSRVAQRVTHFRNGTSPIPPPHERGGTYLESEDALRSGPKAAANLKKFAELFADEFKQTGIGKRFGG